MLMMDQYEATWESLTNYSVPEWYLDSKFGIFIHWGPYCVPAFGNEWYPRNMYLIDKPEFQHHIATYGPQSKFGYKDFIPQLLAQHFDPQEWAQLFKDAGARYVVPVAEHHDGFAMYASQLTRWNAAQMGPRRDVIGELAEAVRSQEMFFGVSSHRAEHWWFMNGGREFDSDVTQPALWEFYEPATSIDPDCDWRSLDWRPRPDAKFLEDWLARCCEIVDRYRPQVFWFDWWIEQIVFGPYLQRFASYYYNRGIEWGKGVVINYKNQSFPEKAAVWDIERGQLKGLRELFWQTDTSISKNSWGYVKEQDYKEAGDIITDLVDIISKNGCMLLNVGPKPDGTIPLKEQETLREIGRWLDVHGEAVFGTRPWHVFGEGPTETFEGHFTDTKRGRFTGEDFRFTLKEKCLYVFLMAWPGKEAVIRSMGCNTPLRSQSIASVRLLGSDAPLVWKQENDALRIALPSSPFNPYVHVLKIDLVNQW
jgi:alpha-L-fucosidase